MCATADGGGIGSTKEWQASQNARKRRLAKRDAETPTVRRREAARYLSIFRREFFALVKKLKRGDFTNIFKYVTIT